MCKSKKRLDGKTALVTSGTDGIGLQIAIEFAKRGARVIVACPFTEEGAKALKIIVGESGNKDVKFKYLDLASLASVRRFVSDILKNESRLDILMNNAGTGGKGKGITKDGINYIMQVNYFGQFLLTILLLPLLLKTGSPSEPSRIVNTGSLMHHIGHIGISELKGATNIWRRLQVYADSKITVLSFNLKLARKLKRGNVVVNAVDPGEVATNIVYGFISFFHSHIGDFTKPIIQSVFKTPWEGAQTALYVAPDEELGKVSGAYFANCQLATVNQRATDEENAQLIWNESARLVGITEEEIDRYLKGVTL